MDFLAELIMGLLPDLLAESFFSKLLDRIGRINNKVLQLILTILSLALAIVLAIAIPLLILVSLVVILKVLGWLPDT